MANEKRLIDANVFVRDLTAMKSVYDAISLDGMIKGLKDAPTVDAVEVVRCRDCMWYSPDTEWGINEVTGKYDHSKIITKPYGECHGQDFHFTEDGFLRVCDDDFCSYGKRKEGDGNEAD